MKKQKLKPIKINIKVELLNLRKSKEGYYHFSLRMDKDNWGTDLMRAKNKEELIKKIKKKAYQGIRK